MTGKAGRLTRPKSRCRASAHAATAWVELASGRRGGTDRKLGYVKSAVLLLQQQLCDLHGIERRTLEKLVAGDK